MQINIPTNAELWLKTQAELAGFDSVEEYALSVLLPSSTQNDAPSQRSFYEAAQASGLIGGGSDYASDLSCNPQYMEGFGR